jgi:uncharacterized protein (TIGR02453 family)
MPEAEDLKAVRTHIVNHTAAFRSIVESRSFRKMFGTVMGEQLLRVPRGFDPHHPAADLVRYKQYLASQTLEPELATRRDFYKTVVETFRTMMPFIRFLNEPIVQLQKTRDRKNALMDAI